MMTTCHLGMKHLFYDLSDSQKIAFAALYFVLSISSMSSNTECEYDLDGDVSDR